MSDKTPEDAVAKYPSEPWAMNLNEVTQHIAIADEKASIAAKELEAAEKALKAAKAKFNHADKYAKMTRDYTKKLLSVPNQEKADKLRQVYRVKFGSLAATQLDNKQLKAPDSVELPKTEALERSRQAVTESINKVEKLLDTARNVVKQTNNDNNETNTPTEPTTQGA